MKTKQDRQWVLSGARVLFWSGLLVAQPACVVFEAVNPGASDSDSSSSSEVGSESESGSSGSDSTVAAASGVWSTRSLEYFRENPSDRFIIDPSIVVRAHPFLGSRIPTSIAARGPHGGGHVYYDVTTWPRGGSAVENYPPIYAVADARITAVSAWYGMGPDDSHCRDLNVYRGGQYERCDNHPDERCGDIRSLTCPAGSTDPTDCTSSVSCSVSYAHYKYDIMMQIAVDAGREVTFSYSIESFVTPSDPRFYEPFIHVTVGQEVRKGDIIAHHYMAGNSGAHIHYQMNRNSSSGGFLSPSIFTQSIVDQLMPIWRTSPDITAGGIPLCMGIYLSASEVPFLSADSGADGEDCL